MEAMAEQEHMAFTYKPIRLPQGRSKRPEKAGAEATYLPLEVAAERAGAEEEEEAPYC